MIIQGYELVNEEKVDRALNGRSTAKGLRVGGVANGAFIKDGVWFRDGSEISEDEAVKIESSLLAEYDKFGGLIKRGDDSVKTGSFYDFKSRQPRSTPKVVFTYRVNGRNVDVEDGKELPGIVKAARQLEQEEKKIDEEAPKKKIRKTK
jgi:hypothetical protein